MRHATRLGLFSATLAAFVFVATSACSDDPAAADPALDAGAGDDDDARGDGGGKPSDAAARPDGHVVTPDGSGEGGVDPDAVPTQLTALAKYFAGEIVKLEDVPDAGHVVATPVEAGADDPPLEAAHAASRWGFLLANGVVIPWDDGRAKTFDQTLADPDLEDMLLMPYTPGAIVPVNQKNQDPGRIRNDELFKQTFGASAAAVEARLENVLFVDETQKFHELAADALSRVSDRLNELIEAQPEMAQYVSGGPLGGTYEWRPILNTNRLSVHSYGAAIDIIVEHSNYWEWAGADFEWENHIPQAIVDAFEAEQFVWGGRWYHYDTMHFEYRPELYDPDCKL